MTTNATRRARQHKIIAEHEKTIAALRQQLTDAQAENERVRLANVDCVLHYEMARADCVKKDAALQTLRAAFRVNMLRALPDKSHAEIDAEIDAALAPAAQGEAVPEPVYKAVERILDEESAWIARPNREVTQRIALAATIAAQTVLEKMVEFDVAPAASAGETRAAIIEQCATIAEDADRDCGLLEIAAQIRALAAAPTTGETVRLDQVFAEFEKRTEAVPLGHENVSRGASTYNWRQAHLQELREIAAAPTTGETCIPSAIDNRACVSEPPIGETQAPAPSAGETVVDDCARAIAADYGLNFDRSNAYAKSVWRDHARAAIRFLAAAPTTGET